MTTNTPTIAQVRDMLANALDAFKALDLATAAPEHIAPLANLVKDATAYGATLHAEIVRRVILEGGSLPGVATKDEIKHRQWHDKEAAEALAQEQFGDKAFKRELLSPAQMEKLGDLGKQFVAVASFKPEAGKRVVY